VIRTRAEIALGHGGDSRLALLNNERRKEFQRGGAVVDADVNLASINIERLSRFIGGRRATFMFWSAFLPRRSLTTDRDVCA
jgi:hypothetical protein